MKFKNIIIVALLLAGLGAAAQTGADAGRPAQLPSGDGTAELRAALDSDSILVGDQVKLRLTLTGAANADWRFPTLEELNGGVVEALESHMDTTRDKSHKISKIEQTLTLTAFREGRWPIGGLVVLKTVHDEPVAAFAPSDSLFLTVAYVAEADTNNIVVRPDAGVLKEPYTFWEIFRWLVLVLVVAAVVLAIIWIVKRRKEHKPVVVLPKGKPVPADKRAISELEALRRKELWQKGRIKRYYTDLTDIVRRYLRNACGMNAAEMTTKQTLAAFHRVADWNADAEHTLRQLLDKADMVKFAKSQPASHEHDEAMQQAIDFVRKVAEQHRINNPEGEQKDRKE